MFDKIRESVALFGGLFDEVPRAKNGLTTRLAEHNADLMLHDLLEIDGGKQNGVSQEQYDGLVAMMAEIELGKTDIHFDAGDLDPDVASERRMLALKDMAKMLQTDSGRELLSGLAYNEKDKQTTLEFIDDPEKSSCTRAYGRDLEEQQELYAQDFNKAGNDATVRYAPGQSFLQTGPQYEVMQTGDSILFHEMVHAHYRTHGTLAGGGLTSPVDHLDDEIDADEYQATGLGDWAGATLSENQYRQERGSMGDELGIRHRYNPGGEHAHAHEH